MGAVPSIQASQRPELVGRREFVQLRVEPADAEPGVAAQTLDFCHVAPDNPGRLARFEDPGARQGRDQFLSLKLPPLVLFPFGLRLRRGERLLDCWDGGNLGEAGIPVEKAARKRPGAGLAPCEE